MNQSKTQTPSVFPLAIERISLSEEDFKSLESRLNDNAINGYATLLNSFLQQKKISSLFVNTFFGEKLLNPNQADPDWSYVVQFLNSQLIPTAPIFGGWRGETFHTRSP